MHAPSVGEGLQARPVLQLFRERRPEVQLVYTFFSPSAESFARSLAVDYTDYLPFDTKRNAAALLRALQPTALVYAKLDVWPLLTEAAAANGVHLGLVSGTLAPGSSRRGWLARTLLAPAYAALHAVGAVSAADGERLVALGVAPDRVQVTGDTRYDQVAARARGVDRASPLLARLASDRPTLVAGSTWPADERVLLAAWLAVRQAIPAARLVIAPHEPVEHHLAPIEAWARQHLVTLARLGSPGAATAEVVLVDRTGVLAELYALATAAWVGGGFHAAGLHSVLEPAAYGVPVAFGPRHHDARDAVLLLERQGGVVVDDVGVAADTLVEWLRPGGSAQLVGGRARALVEEGVGAAARTFELVSALLHQPARVPSRPTTRRRPDT